MVCHLHAGNSRTFLSLFLTRARARAVGDKSRAP
jgi:hypothetical protein